MIKIHDKKINYFLELYANGYSEIPGEAFVKAGFVNSLDDSAAPMLYRELMSKPKVQRFIENFQTRQRKARKKPLGDRERLIYLSNLVRDSSLYHIDKSGNVAVKDAKHLVLAIKELNSMLEDPVKKVKLMGDKDNPLHTVTSKETDLGKELNSVERAEQVLAILAEHDGLPVVAPSKDDLN